MSHLWLISDALHFLSSIKSNGWFADFSWSPRLEPAEPFNHQFDQFAYLKPANTSKPPSAVFQHSFRYGCIHLFGEAAVSSPCPHDGSDSHDDSHRQTLLQCSSRACFSPSPLLSPSAYKNTNLKQEKPLETFRLRPKIPTHCFHWSMHAQNRHCWNIFPKML